MKYLIPILLFCSSAFGQLVINNQSPCVAASITGNPASVTNITNSTVSFTVTASASSTGPLSYQWQTNSVGGSDVAGYSGFTSSTLWVSNLTAVQSNWAFRCIVTNSCGNVTSTVAMLTVTNGTGGGGDYTDNLIAWYKLDDGTGVNCSDSADSHAANLTNRTAPYELPAWSAPGVTGSGWCVWCSTNNDGGCIDLGTSFSSYLSVTSTFSVSLWFAITNSGNMITTSLLMTSFTGANDDFINIGINPSVGWIGPTCYASGYYSLSTACPSDTSWHNIVVTWTPSTLKSYLDNVAIVGAGKNYLDEGQARTVIGSVTTRVQGANFSGFIDDVRFYSVVLTTNQVNSIYLAK